MKLIKIGKGKDNDICKDFVNDITVSKEHCQIFIDDQGNKFLTDLNSTNGTFVNNNKILEPVMLNQYDIVRAGNSLVNWKEFLHNPNKRNTNASLLKSQNIVYKTEADSKTNIEGKFNNKNKSGFFKRYFTYDNEYISGSTYFIRLFLWQFLLLFFILPGFYWIGIVAFKRGKSIGWNDATCYITSILLAMSPIIIITIPIHFVLWFSKGKK